MSVHGSPRTHRPRIPTVSTSLYGAPGIPPRDKKRASKEATPKEAQGSKLFGITNYHCDSEQTCDIWKDPGASRYAVEAGRTVICIIVTLVNQSMASLRAQMRDTNLVIVHIKHNSRGCTEGCDMYLIMFDYCFCYTMLVLAMSSESGEFVFIMWYSEAKGHICLSMPGGGNYKSFESWRDGQWTNWQTLGISDSKAGWRHPKQHGRASTPDPFFSPRRQPTRNTEAKQATRQCAGCHFISFHLASLVMCQAASWR